MLRRPGLPEELVLGVEPAAEMPQCLTDEGRLLVLDLGIQPWQHVAVEVASRVGLLVRRRLLVNIGVTDVDDVLVAADQM